MITLLIRQQRIKRQNFEPERVHFHLPRPLKRRLERLAWEQRKSLALMMRELIEGFTAAVQAEIERGIRPARAVQLVLRRMVETGRKDFRDAQMMKPHGLPCSPSCWCPCGQDHNTPPN